MRALLRERPHDLDLVSRVQRTRAQQLRAGVQHTWIMLGIMVHINTHMLHDHVSGGLRSLHTPRG